MKKYVYLFFLLAFLILMSGCGEKSTVYPTADENAKIIFFFGNTCPHCKIVEEFFNKNKITEKIDFEQAEVYTVPANAEIMKKKAEICKMNLDKLGVPMLWNDGQCLSGDKDIINFFNQKINEAGAK